jgi:hypothetical protein
MTPDERKRAAQTVLEIPFFLDLMNEIEQSAITACLNAKYNDHEARQHKALEASVVRKLRSQLESIANDGHLDVGRKAPA